MSDDWLERQAVASARHLLALDPALLSPTGRELLPVAARILEKDGRPRLVLLQGGDA